MKFMLLFCADEEGWAALPEEERNTAIGSIGAWFGQQAGAGRIVDGNRLGGKTTARTVRLGPAGRSRKPTHTDGPFTESKEVIGSYAVVEASDLDEAVRIAESWPAGGAVEVRPIVEG